VTATIVERDAMVDLLRREYDALAELSESLDEAAWDRPTCLPGWTVKDNLSHVVGTESMLLGEPTPDVDITHLSYLRNDVARANEAWIESMRPLPGAEVLDRFRTVTARRLDALDAMTQADFDAPSWTPAGPDETYGRFMRIRHFDCFMHELDQREALGVADRTDADHVASALTEPASGLGFIVGKRAGVPAGSSVRIHLHGPVDVTYLVDVGDRARVVDALDGEPTAGIDLDALLFLRLTGGRRDATPHLGTDIALEGDEALARQLATHLPFTI
jgi:uncharacterized protein (TIGR03083 family)